MGELAIILAMFLLGFVIGYFSVEHERKAAMSKLIERVEKKLDEERS